MTTERRPLLNGRVLDEDMLLDAAAELFSERGFQATTMQDLANKLGVAKPTIYAYAKNKAGILEGIIERTLRATEDALLEAQGTSVPSGGQIAEVVRSLVRLAVSMHTYWRVFIREQKELPEPARRHYLRWSAELQETIRRLIEEGQRRGTVDGSLDANVTAFAIMSACSAPAVWFPAIDALPLDQMSDAYCELLLGGLLSNGERARAQGASTA